MFELIFNGSKLTFSLMWIFGLPLFVEMEAVLGLWLKEVPEYAILFTRLALIESLIVSISLPLTTAARAPGKMRKYELILGSIQITLFVVSWLVINIGYPAYSVFVVAILFNFLMFIVRLYIVSNLVGINLRSYIELVLLPVLTIIFLSASTSLYIDYLVPDTLLYSILTSAVCFLISIITIYFIGLNKTLRVKVNEYVKKKYLSLK
jgi:hypothetical protein